MIAAFIIGAGVITLACGAFFGPWGLCVLPAGLLFGYIIFELLQRT
jgi:hypothetical protein